MKEQHRNKLIEGLLLLSGVGIIYLIIKKNANKIKVKLTGYQQTVTQNVLGDKTEIKNEYTTVASNVPVQQTITAYSGSINNGIQIKASNGANIKILWGITFPWFEVFIKSGNLAYAAFQKYISEEIIDYCIAKGYQGILHLDGWLNRIGIYPGIDSEPFDLNSAAKFWTNCQSEIITWAKNRGLWL